MPTDVQIPERREKSMKIVRSEDREKDSSVVEATQALMLFDEEKKTKHPQMRRMGLVECEEEMRIELLHTHKTQGYLSFAFTNRRDDYSARSARPMPTVNACYRTKMRVVTFDV